MPKVLSLSLILILFTGCLAPSEPQQNQESELSFEDELEAELGSKDEIKFGQTLNKIESEPAEFFEDQAKAKALIDAEYSATVRNYFYALNQNDFKLACSKLERDTCDPTNPNSLEIFATERQKYQNGYENLEIIDPQITHEGQQIVCVKYSYRLKVDENPQDIFEMLSFYLRQNDQGEWQIAARVCEKKFKANVGERDCPFEAKREFCTAEF